MSPGTLRTARRALAAVTAAVVLAVPTHAGATTASVSEGALELADGNGDAHLTVSADGGALIVADPERDVLVGPGCTQTAATPKAATCPALLVTAIRADVGGGDDVVDTVAGGRPATVYAGPGNDRVTTGPLGDFVYGQEGFDLIDGGLGDDTLDGGADGDSARYGSHTAPVTVDLGSDQQSAGTLANGQAGESDALIRFEYAHGGAGDDTLIGDSRANVIRGGDGDDRVRGGGAADWLEGGAGSDTADYSDKSMGVAASLDGRWNDPDGDVIAPDVENLTGGPGPDRLTGGSAANRLSGGPGADTLDAAGGADVIDAGTGADSIAARDGGADSIACGDGSDSGEVDASDVLSADCESAVLASAAASRPEPASASPAPEQPVAVPPPGDGGAGTADDHEAPIAIRTPAVVRLTAAGALPVRVGCTAAAGTCRGRIELFEQRGALRARATVISSRRRKPARNRAIRLARRSFAVRAGKTKTVPLRLDRGGRRRIIRKKRRRTRGKIVVTLRTPDGRTATIVKNVSIAAPKKRRTARRSPGRSRRESPR